MSLPAWAEAAARSFEPPTTVWDAPGQLAQHLDPRTIQTPALDIVDAALIEAFRTPNARLIITMPPQEGKSTRAAKDFPLWVLTQAPDTRIVTASYGQGLANRNGRAIRNAILTHPEAGLQIAADNGAAHEWQIAGHDGGVLSVGIGAGLTGRPADLMVID
ncbi:MAG: terminase, partial [Propionicimonas sp.]